MSCNCKSNHCHKCEKAKHWDFYFAVLSFIFAFAILYFWGWEAFSAFWPFWLIVGIVMVAGIVVKLTDKKKDPSKK